MVSGTAAQLCIAVDACIIFMTYRRPNVVLIKRSKTSHSQPWILCPRMQLKVECNLNLAIESGSGSPSMNGHITAYFDMTHLSVIFMSIATSCLGLREGGGGATNSSPHILNMGILYCQFNADRMKNLPNKCSTCMVNPPLSSTSHHYSGNKVKLAF